MVIDERYLTNRFAVTPAVRSQLEALLAKGTIRIQDSAGATLYTAEYGLPILGSDAGVGRVVAQDLSSVDELLEVLVAQLRGLDRDGAYEAEWIGADDASALWEAVDALRLWIMIGWASDEIVKGVA